MVIESVEADMAEHESNKKSMIERNGEGMFRREVQKTEYKLTIYIYI